MGRHGSVWQVPGYTEIRELGSGGSGRVVLARHDADDTPVAIKYLNPRLLADADVVEKFREEARLIASLDDAHTVRLYEYAESADGAAIVMELVDGPTLRRLITQEGATGPEAALLVLKGSLLGLAAAHRVGVVHRDFKPENVIVTEDGDSKLVDFGVAVLTGRRGAAVGTPPYMAPEQWESSPASPATDVYAATVTFFECLAGDRPFQGETMASLAYQHQNMPPPVDRVPEPLRGLIEHGMAKAPEDRPVSAEEFLRELEASATAAYGDDWEETGRAGLRGLVAAAHTGVFSLAAPPPDVVGTALAQTKLAPAVKFAVAGALAVTTGAAIIGAFTILNGPPETRSRAAPATSRPTGPAVTFGPATPLPRGTGAPSVTPTLAPTLSPGESGPPEATAAPNPVPSRARGTGRPGPGPRPIRTRPAPRPASRPTAGPTSRPAPQPTPEPTSRPSTGPGEEPTADPGGGAPSTQPEAPRPDPGNPPVAQPPDSSARRRALLDVDVSLAVDTPVLDSRPDAEADVEADVDVTVAGEEGLLGLDLGLGMVVPVPPAARREPYGAG